MASLLSNSPHRRSLYWLLLFVFLLSGYAGAGDKDEVFPEIKGKFPSASESHPVNGEMIDYCGKVQVLLESGDLYRRRDPVGYDYYFLGKGRINIIDTAGLEVNWRHSFGNKRSLEFTQGYICGRNVPQSLMFDPGGWQEAKIDREHWQKLQFMVDAPERYFWVNLSGELGLRPDEDGFSQPIWMQLELADGKNVVFYIAPDLNEQLNIYHTNLDFQVPFLVAGYRVDSCMNLSSVEFDSSVISLNLRDYGKFEVSSDIFFSAASGRRGMNLFLPAWFKVDSVLDAHGQPMRFIKKKERNYLYLPPRPPADGGPDHVKIYYQGKFLKPQYEGYDLPAHLTNWFPHLPRRSLGYYTIHYTLHKDLTLISPGTKIAERIDGDYKTVTYANKEISYTSFAYGKYDTLYATVAEVPFALYLRKENSVGLFTSNESRGYWDGLTDAFEFFTERFGPPSAKSILVVDQPQFLAQSSPGLIHLTMVTHLPLRYRPRIRAHEMAHQWWGHSVIPATFRDTWLSEGIAEYSSALYVLKALNDTADYKDQITEWRRDVIEEGRIGGQFSRGYKAGSILTGSNLFMSHSPGDYWALVYSKAAYMMEMLRFEIDGSEFRTDFFEAMLAEFRRTFFEKQATSIDFIRIAAKYIGDRRAAIFFKQWLFDWKVPEFECHYTIKPDNKNRPIVEISIDVSGVEPDFETPFPVEIEFDDGSRRLFRVDGVGQKKDHILGPFPDKITKIRFDPDHIILSRDTKVVGS